MIKLEIQNPVLPEETPTNVYELVVDSYHGDADHDERTWHRFAPNAAEMEQLYMTLEILEAYEKAGRPYVITTGAWDNFIHFAGIDTSSVKYIADWISELLAWDITSNGDYLTTYSGYDLVFYDVHGVKRNVAVEHTDGIN